MVNGWAMTNENCLAQRRRQMILGTYLQYEKPYLGCGVLTELDCEKKGWAYYEQILEPVS